MSKFIAIVLLVLAVLLGRAISAGIRMSGGGVEGVLIFWTVYVIGVVALWMLCERLLWPAVKHGWYRIRQRGGPGTWAIHGVKRGDAEEVDIEVEAGSKAIALAKAEAMSIVVTSAKRKASPAAMPKPVPTSAQQPVVEPSPPAEPAIPMQDGDTQPVSSHVHASAIERFCTVMIAMLFLVIVACIVIVVADRGDVAATSPPSTTPSIEHAKDETAIAETSTEIDRNNPTLDNLLSYSGVPSLHDPSKRVSYGELLEQRKAQQERDGR